MFNNGDRTSQKATSSHKAYSVEWVTEGEIELISYSRGEEQNDDTRYTCALINENKYLHGVQTCMYIRCKPLPFILDCTVMPGSLCGVPGSQMVSHYLSTVHNRVIGNHLTPTTTVKRCKLHLLWRAHYFTTNISAKENRLLGSIGEFLPNRKSVRSR